LPPNSKFCNECGAPVTHVAQSAEYKQVTVLFADMVRSMDTAATLAPWPVTNSALNPLGKAELQRRPHTVYRARFAFECLDDVPLAADAVLVTDTLEPHQLREHVF
jgi:hypothetical protein